MSDEANNTLSELKNELKGAINVRLRSPLAGLFALSWLLINHRVLFVLFSDLKVGKRFDYIDSEIYGAPGVWFSMNVLLPLASTAFFLLVMPWISALVHRWNLWHQRRHREEESRSEGLQLLTLDQSKELRALIVKRDRINSDLAKELKAANAHKSRYVCMHKISAGVGNQDLEQSVTEYLILNRFGVELIQTQSLRQVHTFDESGYVGTAWHQGQEKDGPEKWSLDGAKLSLLKENGDVYMEANLDPADGLFRGLLRGAEFRMRQYVKD